MRKISKIKLPIIQPHPYKEIFKYHRIPHHLLALYTGVSMSTMNLYLAFPEKMKKQVEDKLKILVEALQTNIETAEKILTDVINKKECNFNN